MRIFPLSIWKPPQVLFRGWCESRSRLTAKLISKLVLVYQTSCAELTEISNETFGNQGKYWDRKSLLAPVARIAGSQGKPAPVPRRRSPNQQVQFFTKLPARPEYPHFRGRLGNPQFFRHFSVCPAFLLVKKKRGSQGRIKTVHGFGGEFSMHLLPFVIDANVLQIRDAVTRAVHESQIHIAIPAPRAVSPQAHQRLIECHAKWPMKIAKIPGIRRAAGTPSPARFADYLRHLHGFSAPYERFGRSSASFGEPVP